MVLESVDQCERLFGFIFLLFSTGSRFCLAIGFQWCFLQFNGFCCPKKFVMGHFFWCLHGCDSRKFDMEALTKCSSAIAVRQVVNQGV